MILQNWPSKYLKIKITKFGIKKNIYITEINNDKDAEILANWIKSQNAKIIWGLSIAIANDEKKSWLLPKSEIKKVHNYER